MARRFLVSVFVSDLVALGVALLASAWLVFGAGTASIPRGSTLWPFVGLMSTGAVIGSWVNGRTWANSVPRPTYGRAFAIVAFASTFTAFGLVLTRVYWSRPMFGLTIAIWFILVVAHRAVRRRRPWTEKMVIISAEKQLIEDLRESAHTDVVVAWEPTEQPSFEMIGDDVSIVVDLRSVLSDSMAQFVSSASIAGYDLRTMSNVYEEHTGRIPMVHLAEGWELTQPVARSTYAPVKRAFDFGLTLVTAPLWLLLSAVVWVVVKLGSSGRALYHQERIGRGGRPFTLHKFRTMSHDAEPDGPRFARLDDPRITRAGRFLRRSRLDELPQLWNVIKGDLSIIGPRPERPVFVEQFEKEIPFYASRHLIRPGVTGWAQVNYGYADDLADAVEKLTYDLYYVKHSSPWVDLHIAGLSIWTVITGSGAR
jgi:exopolysaccharide biosynthesis polyprenyl glycosylphosphotransferase